MNSKKLNKLFAKSPEDIVCENLISLREENSVILDEFEELADGAYNIYTCIKVLSEQILFNEELQDVLTELEMMQHSHTTWQILPKTECITKDIEDIFHLDERRRKRR